MTNKRWLLTISLLILITLAFVYVKGQVIPEKTSMDASKQSVKTVAFNGSLPSFSQLVNHVKPTIVNISTTTVITGPDMQDRFMGPVNPFRDFFGEDFFDRFFGNSPRREHKQKSLGSGFVIDKEGYILTNNHVVERLPALK
jgi:serine protease Do